MKYLTFTFAALLLQTNLVMLNVISSTALAEDQIHKHNLGNEEILYTCPMHPSYISKEPGRCPICGMDLIKISPQKNHTLHNMSNKTDQTSMLDDHATISLSKEQQNLINLQTQEVKKKLVITNIRAAGRVAVDEEKIHSLTLRYRGWIEILYANKIAQFISSGSPLFTIYSPDLYEAKITYVLTREQNAKSKSPLDTVQSNLLQNAKSRLELWGLTDKQIKELNTSNAIELSTTIYSQLSGNISELNVAAGSYIDAGAQIMEITDLSQVWIIADVFPSDVPNLKEGLSAKVQVATIPNETLDSFISYIYPNIKQTTQTTAVRLVVDNKNSKLKPGDYAWVEIQSPLEDALVVNSDSIIDTGERQLAFVKTNLGSIEPRQVQIKFRTDTEAVILSGLSEGETVLDNANFLVDSESRMQAALKNATALREHSH